MPVSSPGVYRIAAALLAGSAVLLVAASLL
jgi:hypothetical protein